MGCLTLAQKRTYADNHSTGQWMREPWVYGRRRRATRKRDILNPWDKKPTTRTPGEEGYSRKAPTAPQIAPITLRVAAAAAAAEARSDSLAAAKLRAAAAEQYVRQTVPQGTSLVHKALFRCSTAVGVAAARVGLFTPQMENTVAVPAKVGAGDYLKQPRSSDNEAVEVRPSDSGCVTHTNMVHACTTQQWPGVALSIARSPLLCLLLWVC